MLVIFSNLFVNAEPKKNLNLRTQKPSMSQMALMQMPVFFQKYRLGWDDFKIKAGPYVR